MEALFENICENKQNKANWNRKSLPAREQLWLCRATVVPPLIRHRRSKKNICMYLSVPRINVTQQRGLIETNKTSETKEEIRAVFIMLYLRNGFIATLRQWSECRAVGKLSKNSPTPSHARKNTAVKHKCACVKVQMRPLTCRMRHQSDRQLMSSQGWNIPRVTQLSRITSMDMCSNHVQEVKVKTSYGISYMKCWHKHKIFNIH